MALYRLPLLLLSFVAANNAAALPGVSSLSPLPDISTTFGQTVYQFDNGTWIENIATRANGNLLLALVHKPKLYEVDPRDSHSARLIHCFSEYESIVGIAEVSEDVFVVAAGNATLPAGGVRGSWSIWKVTLGAQAEAAQAVKVTDIPDALFLNGMTALQPGSNAVLVADSTNGVVYRVDSETGKYAIVLRDETFLPPKNALPIGINGIRLSGQLLYYSNSLQQLFGSVPINTSTGEAIGSYNVIGTDFQVDDFAVDSDGSAYVAAGTTNQVFKIGPYGKSTLVAGATDSAMVEGATSVMFGRTWLDKDVIYVTTSGGQASVLNGISVEGGKVVALHV